MKFRIFSRNISGNIDLNMQMSELMIASLLAIYCVHKILKGFNILPKLIVCPSYYSDIDRDGHMKYHVSVDCQESYISPRGYIFPKRAALRENITILAPPTRNISSVPVNIW